MAQPRCGLSRGPPPPPPVPVALLLLQKALPPVPVPACSQVYPFGSAGALNARREA